jgi:hypothetical protein
MHTEIHCDYDAVRKSLLCGKPSHSLERSTEMDASPVTRFCKLQYNDTTKLVSCKRPLQDTVTRIIDKMSLHSYKDGVLKSHLSRVDIQVCHKKGKTLGSEFK